MTWADGLALFALAAVAFNIYAMFRNFILLRRLKRINAAMFITLTMAWTMRGWHLDLTDDDGPKLIEESQMMRYRRGR
jgi:hypothetical protein